jgi:hypothetical protein
MFHRAWVQDRFDADDEDSKRELEKSCEKLITTLSSAGRSIIFSVWLPYILIKTSEVSPTLLLSSVTDALNTKLLLG